MERPKLSTTAEADDLYRYLRQACWCDSVATALEPPEFAKRFDDYYRLNGREFSVTMTIAILFELIEFYRSKTPLMDMAGCIEVGVEYSNRYADAQSDTEREGILREMGEAYSADLHYYQYAPDWKALRLKPDYWAFAARGAR